MENISLNNLICNQRSCLEAFAMKFTNYVEDANDLVQDKLIKTIRYHFLYKQGNNLKGWLYIIMKNTFINRYRRNRRKTVLIDTTEDFAPYQLGRSAANNQAENKFVMEDIQKALTKLQPEYSKPF